MKIFKNPIYINLLNLLVNFILYLFVVYNSDFNIVYLTLFYLSSFFFVFCAFNYKSIFFEKFLSLFIWLGFPFKLAIPYVALSFGYEINPFPENSSLFNFTKNVYDNAIIFSTHGILGFLSAILIRKKFIFFYSINKEVIDTNLRFFYHKYTYKILLIYIIAIISITFLNLYFEIYQKGISSNFRPTIIVYIFKWLLIMGLSSFACYFVYFEIINRNNYKISFAVFLIESFLSNISILSRSFIFNAGISFLLLLEEIKKNIKINFSVITFIIVFASILVFLNINISSKLRDCIHSHSLYENNEKIFLSKNCLNKDQNILKKKISNTINKISSLSIARWVGIDSMMAIMNKKDELNFQFYYFFLGEKKMINKNSYYEENFLNNKNYNSKNVGINKIILPGFISYQAISGSKFFVFISCLLLGIIGGFLEKFCYRCSYNNFVLSAFISYIFVFRMIHFGYLPFNTLVYFIVIIFTFLQFRIFEFLLSKFNS